MADVMSSPERKNPFGAIDAFERAFGNCTDVGVELVVKVSNGERDPAAMERLRMGLAAEMHAGVHLIEDYLGRSGRSMRCSTAWTASSRCTVPRASGLSMPRRWRAARSSSPPPGRATWTT
jgi:hypothetical protein